MGPGSPWSHLPLLCLSVLRGKGFLRMLLCHASICGHTQPFPRVPINHPATGCCYSKLPPLCLHLGVMRGKERPACSRWCPRQALRACIPGSLSPQAQAYSKRPFPLSEALGDLEPPKPDLCPGFPSLETKKCSVGNSPVGG